MRIRRLNHSVYQTSYHVVWGTKYRRKIIKDYVRKALVDSFYKTLRRHPAWYIHNINTDVDHVHMLLEIPPMNSVAAVVQELKSCSSQHLKKQFKFLRERVYPNSGIWSVGYFVSTVGLNEEMIRRYIDDQNSYDKGIDVSALFS